MYALLLDLRTSARSLARTPGFSLLAIGILTLAIGSNTLIFSLLDAVLLRALPYQSPDELVTISVRQGGRAGRRAPVALAEAARARSKTIAAASIHNVVGGVMRTVEGPVAVLGQRVSPNFVALMGIAPLAGRGFRAEEGDPGSRAVMLVAFDFWQTRLGRDQGAVGSTLYVDEVAYQVVGVMPPEFRSYLGSRTAFWTPYGSDQVRRHEAEIGHELVARMSPGTSLRDAQDELNAIASTLPEDVWSTDEQSIEVRRLKDEIIGDSAVALNLLMAAVAVLLAIACANLAQLLLARSDRRIGELATRKAIGASWVSVARLTLAETLLLSTAGGAGGLILANWLLPVALALAPAEIPRIAESTIDGSAVGLTVALIAFTGCAVGLIPAVRLSRLPLVTALKRDAAGSSRRTSRFQSALVIVQIASSVVLCVLAGLIGQSFLNLLPTDPGFEADSRTVQYLSLPPNLYPETEDRVRRWEDLMQRMEALPAVAAVAMGTNVPFGGDDGFRALSLVGDGSGEDDGVEFRADLRAVSPSFFEVLRMPLLQGRRFNDQDRHDRPGVAIVNQSLARRLAPQGDVLGRIVRVGGWAAQSQYEVVGVVADTRSNGMSADAWDELYIPHRQSKAYFGFLIVQSPLGAGELAELLRTEIRAWAPELPEMPWLKPIPLRELMRRSLAGPKFSAALAGAFSAMSSLLAAVGVVGLVGYSMSLRRREFGIRAALGAGRADLLVAAMKAPLALIPVGVAAGLIAALGLARFAESQLYGIRPLDVATFLGAGMILLLFSLVAAYLPARSAAAVEPGIALRHE